MTEIERVRKILNWLYFNNFAKNDTDLAKKLGYTKSSLSQIINGKVPLSDSFLERLSLFNQNINTVWIRSEHGGMIKKHLNEAIPIGNETENIVKSKNGFTFTQLDDGRYKMDIKLVEPNAYAGYRAGYGDSEYIESLPTHSIIVDELKRGFYRAFKVKGDSMYGNTPNAIWDGAIITGRNIPKQYWTSKLHINQWNEFVIVTENDGIVVKQIIAHDVEKGVITCHSYNEDKECYPDYDIYLTDVVELFNVIKVENPR